MPLPRTLLPLAVAAGLALAVPPGASAQGTPPSAHASGGDVPPVIPATVRTRIKRTESALDRLSGYVDDDDATHATSTGKVIRQQLAAAWRGAKYYIKHAPPPPAADAKAHASGGAPTGPVPADPPTVALAVFQLQDDAVSQIVGFTDGASDALVAAMDPTLSFALDNRDTAVEDVHALPPSPAADEARVRARAAGGAVVGTWDTTMPQVTPMLDDELQAIDAVRTDPTQGLQPSAKKLLKSASAQIALTQHTINGYWPPVPADD
jgi:hypothetical protein